MGLLTKLVQSIGVMLLFVVLSVVGAFAAVLTMFVQLVIAGGAAVVVIISIVYALFTKPK